jgi:hypothetical protein
MRWRRARQAMPLILAAAGLLCGCYYDPNTGLTSPYPPPYGYPPPAPGAPPGYGEAPGAGYGGAEGYGEPAPPGYGGGAPQAYAPPPAYPFPYSFFAPYSAGVGPGADNAHSGPLLGQLYR